MSSLKTKVKGNIISIANIMLILFIYNGLKRISIFIRLILLLPVKLVQYGIKKKKTGS